MSYHKYPLRWIYPHNMSGHLQLDIMENLSNRFLSLKQK